MCGIVGYVGDNSASPILIDGLKKLEYRGYDSAGIAVCRNGKITTVKTKGRISDLQQKLDEVGTPQGSVGIGHTRWATHGAPTDANAHPHSGSSGRVTLVHNGIIENYLELKAELEKQGRQFKSQTDTEVLAQLFDSLYDGNPLETMLKVIKRVRGSYAVAVLMSDHPDEILAAKKRQPADSRHRQRGELSCFRYSGSAQIYTRLRCHAGRRDCDSRQNFGWIF